MSDRLTELRRQRALAQEQLAWFDREIDREMGGQAGPVDSLPIGATSTPPTPVGTRASDPDAVLKQYQSSGANIRSEVKRGCFIYFFAAFVLLAAAVAAFYYFWQKRG